jgi:hypothetical protein
MQQLYIISNSFNFRTNLCENIMILNNLTMKYSKEACVQVMQLKKIILSEVFQTIKSSQNHKFTLTFLCTTKKICMKAFKETETKITSNKIFRYSKFNLKTFLNNFIDSEVTIIDNISCCRYG